MFILWYGEVLDIVLEVWLRQVLPFLTPGRILAWLQTCMGKVSSTLYTRTPPPSTRAISARAMFLGTSSKHPSTFHGLPPTFASLLECTVRAVTEVEKVMQKQREEEES